MLKLVGVIAALAGLVGCGSSDPAPTAATAPEATPEAGEDHMFEPGHSRAVRDYYGHEGGGGEAHGSIEAEYHRPPKPATGGVGDTITLTGTNIGVRVRVRLQGLVDDVAAARRPAAGKRYVGVRLRLKSDGIAILEDELDNAVLTYGAGRRARAVTGVRSACSNGFHKLLRMDVGNSATGCVLFELPTAARPRQFQLALEQVPAEAGGRWILR